MEHGCYIGNHSNISTNSTLNGDVTVEDYCFIGSSSVITGQLRIGESAIVGAGAVVIRNVKPRTVVAGVPAKLIKEIE
ncbi:virginiamycin A acetyltransferase [Rodentibacter pneumotropicus]|uniref:Virginiamycin A acetyltransferase n=1 Tax=Rodentibacter pneumotropicus TaxID=758 RepID=A0A448MLM9_9PAST|nr:virginiamycin A acetyltransferase [Rodentibacter pneumotropicus]